MTEQKGGYPVNHKKSKELIVKSFQRRKKMSYSFRVLCNSPARISRASLISRQFKRFSHYNADAAPKVTLPNLYNMFLSKEPIVTLTAHDSISARLADKAGVDIILVGDSLAMVAMGYESTSEITLEDMIYHTRAVHRGAKRPFIISDLPFGSYEQGPDQALASAVAMIKKGRAECVKFEGGRELVPTVKRLSSYGISTCPHIGLTPQRQISTGGFRVQGKTAETAITVLEDALALEEAGANFLLLEGLPARVGEEITKSVNIPTIGIGAGPKTSGQVLVQLDMLGGFDAFVPKFLKRYANLLEYATNAIGDYQRDVKLGLFPAKENCYTMKTEEYQDFLERAEKVRQRGLTQSQSKI